MAKETTITVGSASEDDYGNLWVAPTDGSNKIKIGQKRSHLHKLFQQGNTVKLHWDSYKNKSYVADAELVDGKPALVKEAEKLGAVEIRTDPKNRSYALSYAKDLAVASKIDLKDIGAYAKKFAKYLDTGD